MKDQAKRMDDKNKALEEASNFDIIEAVKERNLETEFQWDCEETHLRSATDEQIVEETVLRNIEEDVLAQSYNLVYPDNEIDKQKVELFISQMHLIDVDQWRHQFKQIQRMPKDMRAKLPQEFTNIIQQYV